MIGSMLHWMSVQIGNAIQWFIEAAIKDEVTKHDLAYRSLHQEAQQTHLEQTLRR